MGFPSSANNGQQYILNGYTYQYDAVLKTWTRIQQATANIGGVTIANNTLSAATLNTASLISNSINASTITGTLVGGATSAQSLAYARQIQLSGDASGSTLFDGSANVTITATLANTGASAGSYGSSTSIPVITVDAKGRVTNVTTSAITVGTPLATPNTTVQRDANASFAANVVTANLVGNVTGNADSASKLTTARTISLAGDATGSASFDGTANATVTVALSNTGVTAGYYTSSNLTVDSKGRIVSISSGAGGSNAARDITTFNTTVGQSTYTIAGGYTVGGIDVYYRGLRLDPNFGEYTATDGSTIVLGSNPTSADEVTVVSWQIATADTASSLASLNTLVRRNTSGSFAANVVTANVVGNLTGTASNATALTTARTIGLSGDASGSATFDGSANATISVTFANSGATSGTYGNTTAIPVITVDAKGRVTNVSTSAISAGTPFATPSTTVQRDENASFAANVVTANVVGNVTGNLTGNVTGNADTASKWLAALTLSLTGDASGSALVDGSANAAINVTLANSGVTAGTYSKVTVDSKGRVTSGASLVNTDIITALGYTPFNQAGGTISGDTTFSGNIVVQGTTTQVNSTQTTLNDPIITLANNATSTDDGKDRGIEFKFGNGTSVLTGFFGYKNSTGQFTFIAPSTNSGEVETGSVGTIAANLVGNVTGTASNAIVLQTARTISLSGDATGSASFDGSANAAITVSLANSGVTAATYGSNTLVSQVTVDDKGRVTSASNVAIAFPVTSVAGKTGTVTLNSADITDASASTAGVLVLRDANGSFAANVITADLVGNTTGTHTGSVIGNVTGTASNATVLQTARTIGLSGDATGSASFDGSADATISVALANSGVTAGTYQSVTVDSKGRVTAGTATVLPTGARTTFIANATSGQTLFTITGGYNPGYIDVFQNGIRLDTNDYTANNGSTVTLANGAGLNDSFTLVSYSIANIAAISNTTLTVTGDASGVVQFNGSANTTLTTTLANSGATAGTYGNTTAIPVVTIDAKGRITNVTTSSISAGTPLVTANTTVQRDANASFAANVVTANLVGNTTGTHTGSVIGNVTGNADTATKLATAQTLSMSGDASGSSTFDGSANASIAVTLANSGAAAGTYGNTTAIPVVTIDAKGRVTNVTTSSISAGTPLSTANTTVQRDANASFAANVITANLVGNVTGNTDTATKLATSRTISVSGDATGYASFDGSENANIAVTFANSGVPAGTYSKVTVDSKGRVTNGSSLANTDITTALGFTPYNANGGTIGGDVTMTGNLVVQGTTTTVNSTQIAVTDPIITLANDSTSTSDGKDRGIEFKYGNGSSILTGFFGWKATTGQFTFIAPSTNSGEVESGTTGTIAANFIGNLTGTASNATVLQTARTIGLSGDAEGSVSFDGSANAAITVTLVNSGVTAATYGSNTQVSQVNVDIKGRVTSASNVAIAFPVSSVAGRTGTVTLSSADITDSTSASTADVIVKRDTNGSFAANVITASLVGTASNAITLQTARTIALSGDATGSASFDGSANATITMVLANSGVTAGTYTSVTVDSKGRVTAGTSAASNAFARVVSKFVANDGDYTFTANGGYTVGQVDVFYNGIRLEPTTEFTATDGNIVTLANSVYGGDTISIISYNPLGSYVGSVSAGTYGSATAIPVLTLDSAGRITSVSTSTISAGTSVATANTTVQRDANASFAANVVTANLVGNVTGSATSLNMARTISLSGDASGSATFDGTANAAIAVTFANSGVSSGTYGNSTAIPVVTIDAKGRITNVSTSAITAGTPFATPNTTVQRDANSSFATNVITANAMTISGDVSMLSLNGGALSGHRNRLVNGCFRFDQRNVGAAQTITAGAALAYTADRWYAASTGANVTGQRVSGSGNTQYNYRFTGNTGCTGITFGQRIEQSNCYELAGTTCTLSVDLANSLLGTVTWTAYYANTADSFGTLASPTRTQIATGTFSVTSTMTRYNAQISVPSAATTGIEIVLSVGAQTSGTWSIANVQFENGSYATPMERRRVGLEQRLCMRYYEKSYNSGLAVGSDISSSVGSAFFTATNNDQTGGTYTGTVMFMVPKRGVPTGYFWDLTGNVGSVSNDSSHHNYSIAAGGIMTGMSERSYFYDFTLTSPYNARAYWAWAVQSEL